MMMRMKNLFLLPWMSFLSLEKQEDNFFLVAAIVVIVDGWNEEIWEERIEKKVTRDEWMDEKRIRIADKKKKKNEIFTNIRNTLKKNCFKWIRLGSLKNCNFLSQGSSFFLKIEKN